MRNEHGGRDALRAPRASGCAASSGDSLSQQVRNVLVVPLQRGGEGCGAVVRLRVELRSVREELSDRTFDTIVREIAQLSARTHAYNMVVTNVPGPPRPVYLLGARMSEIYPLVPLFTGQGAGIALFSYDGQLCWGFNADWDTFPDLHDFVEDVEYEFERLRTAAKNASRGESDRPAPGAGGA